jgi:hypothetical protein
VLGEHLEEQGGKGGVVIRLVDRNGAEAAARTRSARQPQLYSYPFIIVRLILLFHLFLHCTITPFPLDLRRKTTANESKAFPLSQPLGTRHQGPDISRR